MRDKLVQHRFRYWRSYECSNVNRGEGRRKDATPVIEEGETHASGRGVVTGK